MFLYMLLIERPLMVNFINLDNTMLLTKCMEIDSQLNSIQDDESKNKITTKKRKHVYEKCKTISN